MLKRGGGAAEFQLHASDGEDVGVAVEAVDLIGGSVESAGLPCSCGGLVGRASGQRPRHN